MDKVKEYLVPPWEYTQYFADISWSDDEDALVYQHGETFVLREALAQFIDGFVHKRSLIHFGYILHLLDIFLKEKTHRPVICQFIRQSMKQTDAMYRNAGLLAAQVVTMAESLAVPLSGREVFDRLQNRHRTLFGFEPTSGQIDTNSMTIEFTLPLMSTMEFENHVCDTLKKYSKEDIQHWLRYGESPVRNASHLPDVSSESWMTSVMESERLSGSAPFLKSFRSILTIPPRRLMKNDLPLGGYVDVTNRGRIDALLPTQFALDPDDFIRRFADHELLYYRREDPVILPEADVLILLDQGIRTWGDVRLRLAAAAMVLITRACEQGKQVFLATSNSFDDLYSIQIANPKEASQLLEMSDLSPHPSVAISKLAGLSQDKVYDIVQLTHPRCLNETAVVIANQQFASTHRLFALTIDEESNACWGHLKNGLMTRIQKFNIQASQPVKVPKKVAAHFQRKLTWIGCGDAMSSPFLVPHRFKLVDVDFDTEDSWFFVLDSTGRVAAYELTQPDSGHLLPRLKHDNQYTTNHGIVGVSDGFVLMGSRTSHSVILTYVRMGEQVVNSTACLLPSYEPTGIIQHWAAVSASASVSPTDSKEMKDGYYHPFDHRVVVSDKYGSNFINYRIHQNSAQVIYDARSAMDRFASVSGCHRGLDIQCNDRFLHDAGTGQIIWRDLQLEKGSAPATPLSDGNPVHRNERAISVQVGGNTLCVLMQSQYGTKKLYVYQLPGYRRMAELVNVEFFKLSPSGRYLARQVHQYCIQVDDLHSNNHLVLRTRSSNKIRIRRMETNYGWLYIQYGSRSNYLIDWRRDTLECHYRHPVPANDSQSHQSTCVEIDLEGVRKEARIHEHHITFEHRIVADEMGHIWIYDLLNELICVFLLDQADIAGWMPDGTIFGPPRLTGASSTPHAMRLFAKALQASASRHS